MADKFATPEDRTNEATRIMNCFNPIDIDQRATTWRSEKWSGFDTNATPYTQSEFERERSRFARGIKRGEADRERPLIHTYVTERPVDATVKRRTIHDKFRGKNVNIENLDADMRSDYNRYDPLFRTHYQTAHKKKGRSYEEFRPAYFYGYDLAGNPLYRNRTWEQVEMDARRSWESEYHDTLWDASRTPSGEAGCALPVNFNRSIAGIQSGASAARPIFD